MRFPLIVRRAAALLLAARAAIAADELTAADYYVRSLPGAPPGPLIKMHAGHIEVDSKNNGNLFFWHFQNKHIGDRQRTVIWLNGGPGCSSMDGALMEVGPYRLKDDHTLEENPGSWHEFANIMFVDQPVGTGFSYVNSNSYLHELPEMADQFMRFLTKFFELFPEYEQDDIYLAGESYAGQHIPYIANYILEYNAQSGIAVPWNLKGLLIGNGWIDPEPQYMSYMKFAYQNGMVEKDSALAKSLEKQVAVCTQILSTEEGKHSVDVSECEKILQDVLSQTQTKSDGKNMCYNMYDIRKTDTYPSCGMNWPPDLEKMTPYLHRSDVLHALHVNPDKKTGWQECVGAVSATFRAKNSKPAAELLPGILESGVEVTLFSGDRDFICNHIGTEESIHGMEWLGGKGFETTPGGAWAPREEWTFEGEPAGYYQSARNLTYVLFYNASHMVPFDFPRRTRDMLDRFMGVDIASIGGQPTDSRIAGEKGPVTSVGGHPNSTAAQEQEKEKLEAARWQAYYHSGEVALVLVASAAAIWGVFVWRQRQKRQRAGYRGVRNDDVDGRLEAGDFDEGRLDDLDVGTGRRVDTTAPDGERRYSLGGEESGSESEESLKKKDDNKS